MASRRSRSRLAKLRHSANHAAKHNPALTLNPYAFAGVVAVGALAVSALVNRHLAKKADHANPPAGKFLEIEGVLLHYVERGQGEPLVLLHGNGSMIQDFETSGLVDMAAETLPRHCVRPPRLWTQRAAAQHRLDGGGPG